VGIINPALPSPGQPRGSEEGDVRNALAVILTEFNGRIELANLHASLRASLPQPGAIVATGRMTADSGWLLCNGVLQSRTAYPNLFAAIGVAFGVGDGTTTFGIPNLTAAPWNVVRWQIKT
jgi:hypothetical protein